MKKNIGVVLSVINMILLIVCLVWISELKQEVQNTRSNLSSQMTNLLNNVNNSYSYIEECLEEGASIVASAEWEFGEFDTETRTVELVCEVVAKEYQPDITTASIVCNDVEVPMVLENGNYVAAIELSLFEDYHISTVLFRENDVIRTENLDWYISPRYDFLPDVYADFYGTIGYEKTQDAVMWNFSGDVEIDVTRKGDIEVTRIELIRVLGGEEAERVEIPLNSMDGLNHFNYNWNVEYEIPFETVQEIYVEVETNQNLVHRIRLGSYKIGEDGSEMPLGEKYWDTDGEADIYDTQGNLLYTVNEE